MVPSLSEDWASIAADVTAAIADIGFLVSVTHKVGDDLPWAPSNEATTKTVRVIDAKPWRKMLGSSELETGSSLLCAPSADLPAIGDRVTVRGVEHGVLNVRSVAPGGVDLLHVLELSS